MSAALPPLATRQAYVATAYQVAPPAGPTFWIGRPDPEAVAWLAGTGLRRVALMTAYHPMSRVRPDRLNRARMALMAGRVARAGLRALPSQGRGAGDWPPEPGLAVATPTRGKALRLARRWRQHAIVWVEPGRAPRLLWCHASAPAMAARPPRQRRPGRC